MLERRGGWGLACLGSGSPSALSISRTCLAYRATIESGASRPCLQSTQRRGGPRALTLFPCARSRHMLSCLSERELCAVRVEPEVTAQAQWKISGEAARASILSALQIGEEGGECIPATSTARSVNFKTAALPFRHGRPVQSEEVGLCFCAYLLRNEVIAPFSLSLIFAVRCSIFSLIC